MLRAAARVGHAVASIILICAVTIGACGLVVACTRLLAWWL